MSAVAEAWIDLLHHHGAHLLPLRKRVKEPVNRAWPDVRAMTRADALAWLGQCGNLGVNLGASGWIVIDTDNQLGTDALVAAGFTPDVVTANAQVVGGKKEGGRHFVFRAPTGVDPAALHSRTGIKLPAGGVVDVLAGRRFLVAPPTTLDEAGGLAYAAAEGGVFATGGELPEAPAWLTDPEAACPDELLPLRGMALGRGRADREYGADGGWRSEIQAAIDEIPWDDIVGADPRLSDAGLVDTCGCPIWHWGGADNAKSCTLHDGCCWGWGIHTWSGTMMRDANIGEHTDRLNLLAALRNWSDAEKVAWASENYDVPFRAQLAAVTAEDLDEYADRLDGDADAGGTEVSAPGPNGANLRLIVGEAGVREHAAKFRSGAAALRQEVELWAPARTDPAGSYEQRVVVGWTPTLGALALAPEPATAADTAAVEVIEGPPAVDPLLPAYTQRAVDELASAALPIDTASGYARNLLPADLRPLREAVFGPRAAARPVDVEATDGQLAQAITAALGGAKLIHAADAETWYAWDGVRFRIDPTAPQMTVQALLQRHHQAADPVMRQRKIRAWTWKKVTVEQKSKLIKRDPAYKIDEFGDLVGPNGEIIERLAVEVAERAESTAGRNAVVAQIATDPAVAVRTEELDANPAVIGTAGGYIRLADPRAVRDGAEAVTVTAPDPACRVTRTMGAGFVAGATCPRWDQALSDALPSGEVRRWLQKVLGQALFGRQDEHILLVLEGLGGNGKGLVVDVINAVFGDYGTELQTSVLTLAGMNNHATDLMPLKGARFATADEVPPQQLNLDRVKKLTGGGWISGRPCGQDTVEWEQTHLLVLRTNNKLQWAPSAMAAMRRRLRVIRFDVEFGAPGGPELIHGLATAIVAEEASGVLNWLIEGYRMYTAEGLDRVPAEIDEWTSATLAGSSSWAGFCDLALEVTKDPADTLLSADIFPVWDHFRGQDTDQKHASPGSVRVVAAMVCEQLRGVTRIEAKGKTKAGVRGVRWSEAGQELIAEMRRGDIVIPGITGSSYTMPRISSI